MADNFPQTPGAGRNVATDQVTHSGDTADVQLFRLVGVTGSEGSKTVVDLPAEAVFGLGVTAQRVKLDAVAHGAAPGVTAAGSQGPWIANRHLVPFVIGGHPFVQTVRLQFTAAQTDTAVVTAGAGEKIVVTSFQVTLDNASTVFPSVRLGFGAANTPTTTGVIGAHGGLPAGGGFGRGDGSGMLGVGADGEDLRITTVGAATGNGVEVVVTYYLVPS